MVEVGEDNRDARLRAALIGRRIIVTRAGEPGLAFASRLATLGALVEHCPSIAIMAPESFAALDRAIDALRTYDWILFTSANAVHAFAARVAHQLGSEQRELLFYHRGHRGHRGQEQHAAQPLALDVFTPVSSVSSVSSVIIASSDPVTDLANADSCLPPLAAVGNATAQALNAYGYSAQFVARGGAGAALARELPVDTGARVLLPRADIASHELPSALRERNVVVDEVIAYRTGANADVSRAASLLRSGGMDAITFTSPSTVRYFVEGAEREGCEVVRARNEQAITIVCIGETTAAAARACGLVPDAVSVTPSMEGMIDALAACFSRHPAAPRRLNASLSLI